ncbi:uncharacterized protein LOC115239483 [Formica exsecta]|uniref:uncharacterized protein LOC115239483 n=1 Tax=Formica exsecta TaxID=72781 RepID=UPI001142537C|nr:uncharacterized protein LOC115239483 [Formica exsecta]
MSVSALVLPRLTVYAGGLHSGTRTWPHVEGLKLADPVYSAADQVDILLGADVHAAILRKGLRREERREPLAQNTTLGWILSGAIGGTTSSLPAHTHQCRLEDDLASVVRRFWEQEDMPMTAIAISKDEQECEHFVRTHSRGPDGRYTVRLPVIEPLPDLTGTRRSALRLLKQMEVRFGREASFRELYTEFMSQYASLRHMTPVSPGSDVVPEPRCYLPHHGAMREASTTTKLRVMFNGSTKLPTGETLNRHLKIEPNLLPFAETFTWMTS